MSWTQSQYSNQLLIHKLYGNKETVLLFCGIQLSISKNVVSNKQSVFTFNMMRKNY